MSSSQSRATPILDQDGPLLAIGKQCSHPTCHLVDFLPFKCQHCQESFCQDHYKVAEHSCPKYDESKYNRIAPSCPLCNEPVAIRPGQDPNARMEDHFAKECSVMIGHVAKKSTPVCSQRKCGKVLFSPIRCDKCRKDFCPSHRFPSDHSCSAATASTASTRATVPTSQLALKAKASASHTASATLGAIKKTVSSSTSSSAATTSQPSSSKSTVAMPNPFSKVDSSLSLSSSDPNPNVATNSAPIIKSKSTVRANSYAPPPIFSMA
ncbi:hypothetical protein GYMLUDRAFT_180645 [Collybiopsis luxurians FD-317 M1]|uniref:AN1-type domain-containing protein n=1 Tax=Collybiopsis luxurians FD-317 M1 TaxID=944289 RepID=A0A0D0BCD2_9AGAR|nr:hypothetical protein GYMLUDRAFT_180645 [Collybiopsis luxurians FD-317 M1]